ncbi:MAG: HAMP domain-containing sensor histidine kinase [Candidatus Pacebacteria bacterium]|nr:HAMP domain-containing sensor histidine kinase [Candidatus Paceibacterota bacterium]
MLTTNIHLILHDSFGALSVIASALAIILILFNDHKKTINVTLALTFSAVIVFLISDVVGASISDPALSRSFLMWNISVIFICMFNFHCAMAAVHKEKEKRAIIMLVYIAGFIFSAIFIVFPDTFILAPVPKMYLPNYYVPGQLQLAFRIIFQGVIPIYFVYEFVQAYRHTLDRIERNRYLYFALAFGLGWGFGIIPDLLIWNIPVDPMWGLLFPIMFIIPFMYAIFRYDLMDIRIVAKRAFAYGGIVIIVGFCIALLNFSNQMIQSVYPWFPIWVNPLISSILIVAIGIFVWRQLRNNDVLKYEFITVIAHKFRTPLTEGKWAVNELLLVEKDPEKLVNLRQIEQSNEKLVNLTAMLVDLADMDKNSGSTYKIEKLSLCDTVKEAVNPFDSRFKKKDISFTAEYPASDIFAMHDRNRIIFAIQTLLENSRNYTPSHGMVTLSLSCSGKKAMISVTDTGIGIKHEDLPRIFSRFYRAKGAQLADTEGFGIGLSLARSIVNRHGGKIEVYSEGEGKGSVFTIVLPIA